MAKRDDKDDDADDRASSPGGDADDDGADEREADEGESDEGESDEGGGEEETDDEAEAEAGSAKEAAKSDIQVGDDVGALVEGSEDHAVQQMGVQRYVIAAFLVATMLGAYVLGLTVHGVWSWASNRDFFALRLPAAAAVPDESKMTYGTVFGAVVAIAYAVKQYRDPEVRTWTDDVASELTKVKWPSQKDVTNSTIVVIAASAFAMVYLFLLDRLWGFVTGLIYGAGT
jgi:preprotein translocase subunit SecE